MQVYIACHFRDERMRSLESLLIFGQLHAGADIPLRPVGTTRDSLVAAMVLQRALMEGER